MACECLKFRTGAYDSTPFHSDARAYTRGNPELVRLAKLLRADKTLLATSAALAEQGHVTANGKPFSASLVKRLIEARA